MTPQEKKIANAAKQREQETVRRAVLGLPQWEKPVKKSRKNHISNNRPVYGSQEWAETYSDDLGESFD